MSFSSNSSSELELCDKSMILLLIFSMLFFNLYMYLRINTNDCKILYVPRTREGESRKRRRVHLICAMLFDTLYRSTLTEMVKCCVALSFNNCDRTTFIYLKINIYVY